VKPIYNRYYNMYISIGSDGGGREYHAIQGRLHQLLKRTALVKKRVQFCNFFLLFSGRVLERALAQMFC
jgi:hypothetical protein